MSKRGPAAAKAVKMLIVDDEAEVRAVLSDAFEDRGYTVRTAATATEALQETEREDYDAVLIDLRLPDMGGLLLLGRLKDRYPEMVCIIITACGEVESAVEAIAKQADGYFVKPAVMEEVIRRVEEALERIRLRRRLRDSERRYRLLFEAANDAIFLIEADSGRLLEVNHLAEELTGCRREELLDRRITDLRGWKFAGRAEECFQEVLRKGVATFDDAPITRKDGRRVEVEISSRLLEHGGRKVIQCIVRDVTEHKRLQEQLLRAQKLEAVGQLAGGIAHDFNNLITIILGYCDVLHKYLGAGHPARDSVEEIRTAGQRAADLTRQLLAFGRRQFMQPRVLELNALLAGMHNMLGRVLGEDIELRVVPGEPLGNVKADPGQIEQVIMNLAINARDAMPGGGRLIIETANVVLDEEYACRHAGVRPGHYVLLAVSDTGTGMDRETRARLFEPFFTTKGPDRGTGLGLSTVYGIVKQSGGNIWVYSEPGRGATFKVYLPSVAEGTAGPPEEKPIVSGPGTETVLLVEDEETVRELVLFCLKERGYTVLVAGDGEQGLEAAERHQGPLHLLLTDVVMPRMSGPELAARLGLVHPETAVLYMSGYADNAVKLNGSVEDGAFLQKPFTPSTLAHRVREVLDAADGAGQFR